MPYIRYIGPSDSRLIDGSDFEKLGVEDPAPGIRWFNRGQFVEVYDEEALVLVETMPDQFEIVPDHEVQAWKKEVLEDLEPEEN